MSTSPSHPRRPSSLRRVFATALVAAGVLAACGSDEPADSALTGIVRDPAPQVDLVRLPALGDAGGEVEFRAEPGGIEIVYFGFTNCPDVCPTTLADLTVALRRLEPEQADDVDVVMVTVDPDRDLDVLDRYVTSFIPEATAAGTSDLDLLEEAGAPFGASWEVRTAADGSVEVDHSPFLYAVDDDGELVVTWQFGASSEDIAHDLSVLLEDAAA